MQVSIVNGEAVEGTGYAQIQQMELARTATPSAMVTGTNFLIGSGDQAGLKVTQKNHQLSTAALALPGKVLSTATNSGMPVISLADVRDTSVVTCLGIPMTAKMAAAEGFLVRNSDGTYQGGK